MVAALGHAGAAYRLIGQAADVGFVTPHNPAQARAMVAEIQAAHAEAGRGPEPINVFADLVVFLASDAHAAADRKARLDELAGREYTSDAAVFTGTPASSPSLLQEWQQAGLSGFRLRPGGDPRTISRRSPGAWCPNCSAAACSARPTTPARCAGGSGSAGPRAATPPPGGADHGQATEADSPRRALPRREQHHGLERSPLRQPHRVRFLRASGPDRGAGQVRLPVPRRRAAAAGAERRDLRPRRGGTSRHLHRPGRARGGHQPARPGRDDQLHLQRAL